MNEFYVGQYRVDIGRSQIVAQDAIVSMEPKVLQVLLILAEKQGEVVTHQQILDKVWKDVSVAPNTLQRCITQLRKAMGDSAKEQRIIKTHPKMGYSLLVDVSWQQRLSSGQQSASAAMRGKIGKTPFKGRSLVVFGTMGLIIVGLLFITLTNSNRATTKTDLPIDKLTALTATDKKEYAPTFSPDGRYIAFQRYIGLCENEIWAKDLEENREYLLTKSSGIYGTPSWSPNGQQLAFSNVTHCSMTSDFQGCRDIRTLNFALAKSEPQDPQILKSCNGENYSAAVWLDNERVAFFEKSSGRESRVVALNQKTGILEQLYETSSFEFDSLSYSQTLNTLAVTQHNPELKASLLLLDLNDGKSEQIELKPPAGYSSIVSWYFEWHPADPYLISARGNSLFEIDTKGEFVQHPIATMQTISDPVFHPNGESIVASMGIFDKDIQLVEWQDSIDLDKTYQFKTIHRSIVTDREAKFQPGGNRVAYISDASGSQQIWLSTIDEDESNQIGEATQLSHLTDNPQIHAVVWSFDGRLIVALIDGKITLFNLDGEMTSIDTDYRVLDIYQSPSEDQVLIEIVEQQQEKVISLNLKTMQRQDFYQGDVSWAQLSSSGEIFVSGNDKTVFQWKDNSAVPLAGTEGMTLSAIFLANENTLLLNDKDNSLWLYDIESEELKKLFRINQPLKHIDSVIFSERRLLITTVASTKKEVVLFHR